MTKTRETREPTVEEATPRPRGRPPQFDRDVVLDRAMVVFWERGFESASVSELTAAMGITPPSLYAAFGDKIGLFLAAVDRYGSGPGSYMQEALEKKDSTAREAIEGLLREAAARLTGARHPLGCMVVSALTQCSDSAEPVRKALAKRRSQIAASIKARIERGIEAGEMPADTDAAALGGFVAIVFQGMSARARDGASKESLLRSVEIAMRAWPSA